MQDTSVQLDTTHSPHDGGWYCEVVDRKTGKTLHTTEIHLTEEHARTAAQNWVKLIQGISRYDSSMPGDLPAGLIGEYEYPGISASMYLKANDRIWAHASDVVAAVGVGHGHNKVEIHGSIEQLRHLCAEWSRQLAEIEAEARGELVTA